MKKSHHYLRKAAEFAARAETATDAESRIAYRNLAECYRRLSENSPTMFTASDAEIEALARRIVER